MTEMAFCQEEWIRAALETVLSNKGARTAGIDGVTKKDLATEEARRAFIQEFVFRLRMTRKQYNNLYGSAERSILHGRVD